MALAAVTGATGFLGRRLVDALHEGGHHVRVLARRPPAAETWSGPVDIVPGDLADAGALARLTDGADVVIHAAGLVKARSRTEFFAANARGTADLARATRDARFVLVSSLSAREPTLSAYAASKAAGETLARPILGDRLTVIRPPAIYGPGDLATLDLFRAAVASPLLPIPQAPQARLALAYVDDVAAAVCHVALTPCGPGPFEIGGARPEGYGWREIAEALARAAGRPARIVEAPAWLLLAAGAASEVMARLSGSAAMFSLGKAREFLHADWAVNLAAEPPLAGFAPMDLETGFVRTLAWYRAHGWIH
jgi:nucleoside-diphosphate-sugar epimerase